jgi:serine/threonine protein kinase/tetratricopeptide (TPR) repeat protein
VLTSWLAANRLPVLNLAGFEDFSYSHPRQMETGTRSLIARRYRIQERLGKGGMGEVWSAVDLLTKKKLALKQLALSGFRSPVPGTGPAPALAVTTVPGTDAATAFETEITDATASFVDATPSPRITDSSQSLRLALTQEFRVLSSLRHPGIISVLDYGFDEQKQPYFTMELLEEPQDLLTATRDLTAVRQVSLLIQLLQALVYLHRREILHRDLKPPNVLVQAGIVKVLDFGLARNQDAAAELSGTLRYMAPEIFLGRPATVGSDLYAVGVMAYEVLTGDHPFPVFKTVQDLIHAPAPDFGEVRKIQEDLRSDATPGLDAVLGRLLARNPEDRYPSAVAVIADLSAAIGEPPPSETTAIRESFLQAAEFVGRESELGEFRKLMHGLDAGRGGTVLIGGESGVGKSRLIEEIRTEALVRGVLVLRGQAVAEAGLPYQEWRDPLRRLSLSSELRDEDLTYLQIFVPDVGELLYRKVPPLERPEPGRLQRILQATATALFRQQTTPVLLILEDLHWTGDESLSLLRELNELTASHPLLIVGTFRNDEKPELPSLLPKARYMKLSRLRDEAIAKLSKSMLGASGARPAVIEYLKKQTEGNVFFLVEVVRSLAESVGGLDFIASDHAPERMTTRGISDIVLRRLNRVPAKFWPVMELAAIQGRQLDMNVLETALPGVDLAEWLSVAADGMVLDLDDGRWRFAHDKLREALLASLDENKSGQLHQCVALAIEHVYPESARPAPRLAYHWAHAGNHEREQHYAALAGSEMLKSAAYASAIEYLERAVDLLPAVAEGQESQELGLQLCLGTAYLIAKGFTSAEMKRAFDRAGELCIKLGDPTQLFRVLFGQATFYLFSGELEACRELAERCRNHAEQSRDPDMLLEAHFSLGNVLYWQGEFAPAVAEMQQVIAQYRPHQHEVHTTHFGHNPRITCLTYGAWGTWALGYPQRALSLAQEAMSLAEERNHGFSRIIAVQTLAFLHHQRRDVQETRRYAEILIEHAGQYPPYWIAGRFLLGWSLTRLDQIREGTEIIRDAWKHWGQAGAGLAHSLYSTFLLEAALDSGDIEEGIGLATAALSETRRLAERSHEAELCRLRGELVWKLSSDPKKHLKKAEADFMEAVSIARRQQARSYELRALNSLCRHQQDAETRAQLAAAYSWFSEGFETNDLKTARQLLEATI